MIKKKILLFMLLLAFGFVLTACGTSNAVTETPTGAAEVEVVTKPQQTEVQIEKPSEDESVELAKEQDTEETDINGKSVLITYFSHTGNTEEAAQLIAEYTGGDLAEIQRVEEYGDLQEEAEAEILDGVHPEITVSVDNIAGYDTIFVGYPIWWDEAPAMIATFLAENDFSGKTIIPFCTSSSDDIGNSLHIFSELCPEAEIAEGLTANDLNDIEPWILNLGLMKNAEGAQLQSVEGTQIKMITENTEVVITLNDSRAAADLVAMLPLELTLIERNSFAKGMTLPEHLSSVEATTREYEIGDFGYWDAGPDLAIFYDDIYEQTIVEVIPLGHAETGAETMAKESGTVRLELINEEGATENE